MFFEIIKPGTRINFIGFRYFAFALSIAFIIITAFSLVSKGGLKYGVDFAGGLLMQVRFIGDVAPDDIRDVLAQSNLAKANIQALSDDTQEDGSEYLINYQQDESESQTDLSNKVETILKAKFGENKVEIRRVEMVGPKVGSDLRQKALYALYYSILMILIYISGRFENKWGTSGLMVGALLLAVYLAGLLGVSISYLIILALVITLILSYLLRFEYALGAILSLLHDVVITVGVFSLLNKEVTLIFVAAVLTIVGYSLNDTIIIYDRIRERLRRGVSPQHGQNITYAQLINIGINETLSRTILTSGSTLVVIACLYFLGGPMNKDFALALFVGVAAGTYSSIFISAPALLFWTKRNKENVLKEDYRYKT